MNEFNLINKNRDRIKIFKPFDDISQPSPTLRLCKFNKLAFIKDQVKQLLKVKE